MCEAVVEGQGHITVVRAPWRHQLIARDMLPALFLQQFWTLLLDLERLRILVGIPPGEFLRVLRAPQSHTSPPYQKR